ncbi:MAG: AraC family transcriptional regulator [Eubacteriales bacterium]|nr:AraC family transcriptional regulator [Eubacteriales bacterium]
MAGDEGTERILKKTSFNDMLESGYFYRIHNRLGNMMHSHDFYEYMVILEGRFSHTAGGKTEVLAQGSFFLLRPSVKHMLTQIEQGNIRIISVGFTEEESNKFIEIYGSILKQFLFSPVPRDSIMLSPERLKDIKKNFDEMSLLDEESKTINLKIITDRLMHTILKHELREREQYSNENIFLKNVLAKMVSRENICEGMPALLRIANMSHGNLCRLMKRETGMTPVGYITRMRMEYASNLLIHTDESILEISLAVGYDSLSHFIGVFHKTFGATPKKYRTEKRKEFLQISVPRVNAPDQAIDSYQHAGSTD